MSSTSILWRVRKMETIIARPTTTSAAATVSTIKTNICPSAESSLLEMATNDKLTAFNINSIDMKIINGLRRMSTPTTPTVNNIALTMRYADNGIFFSLCLPAQYHRAQQRHDDQQACYLKGIDETVEQCLAKGFRIALRIHDVRKAISPSCHCSIINGRPSKEQVTQGAYQHKPQYTGDPALPWNAISQSCIAGFRGKHGDHKEKEDHDRARADQDLHDSDKHRPQVQV